MSARDLSAVETTCGLFKTLLVVEVIAKSAPCDSAVLLIAVLSGKLFSRAIVKAIVADDNWSTGLDTAVLVVTLLRPVDLTAVVSCGFCKTKANMTTRATTLINSK